MTCPASIPSLSVVMPTRDEPERLQAALRSLAAQSPTPPCAEVIVVDDGSAAYDPVSIRRAAGNLTLSSLRFERNQGRALARNAGLRAARGELVIFLDSDMTVAPDFLYRHAEAHRRDPGVVAIGNILFAPHVRRDALARHLESRGVHRLRPGEPVPFKCFVTGNSSVPRALLERVGLFDEGFTSYGGEDLELGYRLYRAGARFAYVPEALSWHHHARTLEEVCRLMRTYGRSSLPLLLGKHPELAPLLRLGFLAGGRLSPNRLFARAALAPVPFHLILRAAAAAPCLPWPGVLFDYLLWHARTRGFMEAAAARHPGCPATGRRYLW
ncbi:MAG: glycosyltransferase [Candidatus Latescibacterota bacterium]